MSPESDPLQQHSETTATADRRALARADSTRPFPRRCYLVATLEPIDAWIVNLSQGGVALLLTRPLPVGALLFLELESAPDRAPLKVWADVVRCSEGDQDNWQVGCMFVNPLSADDLESTLC
jgi:hypothetical protein